MKRCKAPQQGTGKQVQIKLVIYQCPFQQSYINIGTATPLTGLKTSFILSHFAPMVAISRCPGLILCCSTVSPWLMVCRLTGSNGRIRPLNCRGCHGLDIPIHLGSVLKLGFSLETQKLSYFCDLYIQYVFLHKNNKIWNKGQGFLWVRVLSLRQACHT